MAKSPFAKKRSQSVSKSIRCPSEMWDAFERLAADADNTANGYIVIVLDEYLKREMKKGANSAPKEKKTGS